MSSDDLHVFGHHIGDIFGELSRQLEAKTDRSRTCIFPIRDAELFDSYETQVQLFWTYKTHNYATDRPDFLTMPTPIQTIIKYVLSFFANGDGIIISNIVYRLLATAPDPEESLAYCFQMAMESIHAMAYNKQIDAIIPDQEEKLRMFSAVSELPAVAKLSEWMKKMTFHRGPRAEVLVAFACGEGLLFPTSFVPIFYMRIKNKMPILVDVNKEIARDETLHFEQGITLIKRTGIEKSAIVRIVKECTEILFEYIDEMTQSLVDASNDQLIGTDGIDYSDFKREELIAFAQYNTDSMLRRLDCEPIYNADVSSLPGWLLSLSCSHKNNFHERTSTNYVQSSDTTEEDDIDLDV